MTAGFVLFWLKEPRPRSKSSKPDAAGFSQNQIRRARCRINAVARREGLGAPVNGAGTGRPLDLTMIAFKGAKGIKDCRLERVQFSRHSCNL